MRHRTSGVCLLGVLALVVLTGCSHFDRPPVAVAVAKPVVGPVPLKASFNGSHSYDPDSGFLSSVLWEFGDGDVSDAYVATHTYVVPGIYEARLTVKNYNGGEAFDSVTVTVTPPPPLKPLPTQFARTWDGFWAFVSYCQASWTYEVDTEGELVQSPSSGFDTMRGDCDDFATMVAGYAQEFWGFDSCVAYLHFGAGQEGDWHAAAFVEVEDRKTIEMYYSGCGAKNLPWWGGPLDDRYFLPIDFGRCTFWSWKSDGGNAELVNTSEWYTWVWLPRGLNRPGTAGDAVP